MNSPFNFNNYNADLATVKAKYLQVIESGVRQIALLEDDATGSSAANLSRLLNDLTNWLTELKNSKYPDLKTDIPVSYTHLDVYKRQPFNFRFSLSYTICRQISR